MPINYCQRQLQEENSESLLSWILQELKHARNKDF